MPAEYPVDFKRKIIQRYEKGELSQEFHIAQNTVYHWRKLFCSIQTPQVLEEKYYSSFIGNGYSNSVMK